MTLQFRASIAVVVAATALAAAPVQNRSAGSLFEQLKKSPPELHAFLLRMPKGGDLHNHLSGAIYAESFLDRAAQAPLCVTDTLTLSPATNATCAEGQTSGSRLPGDGTLWNRMVDSLSMRDFVASEGESGADHFFDTFGKFGAASHVDEGGLIAEIVKRAYNQNESYLELMALSASSAVSQLGTKAGLDRNDFAGTRQKLMDAGMAEQVKALQQRVERMDAERRSALQCDSDRPQPACGVEVRYQFQVTRNSTAEEVFAQTLAGFLLADADPRVVAVNFVQREDGYNSLHDYDLHMRMVAYLRTVFPKVHVALHAGELAEGMVPPEDLRFHIRDAVLTARAERIGHGVDIMDENDSLETLRYMREHHIDVEINLTSNAVILGVAGANHPFPVYRKYGVPVTLSTDDEGVSRSDLTTEYERAVLGYGLSYTELKQIVRNSIEYSFATPDEKRRLLADLEKRFNEFERWATANFR